MKAEGPVKNPQTCPACGRPLAANAPGGLCPACLLRQGLAGDTEPGADREPFRAPAVEEVARLFPQLEIIHLLGKGGMGAVYRARQPALDRGVALKVLPVGGVRLEKSAERFNREARALARLNHPNIVGVHEFGEVSGYYYFLMELVDGVNLRQLQQAGRLSPREALQIIPQICDALQYAHDEGVVHRDIKPENVLVDRKGRVKIADFGLAQLRGAEPNDLRLTGEGQVLGTPHYMAPEQIEHPLEVDHRADIYALGVVFYELLTGELPLGKFAPPSERSRGIQIDVRLDQVVLHALEKQPDRRYQHASEVKTDVEGIASTRESPVPKQAGESVESSEVPMRQAMLRRRQRLIWAGFLLNAIALPVGVNLGKPLLWLLGLVGLAACVWGLWGKRRESEGGPGDRAPRARADGWLEPIPSLPWAVPRALWIAVGIQLGAAAWKVMHTPDYGAWAVADLLLILGLLLRLGCAHALVLFFALLGILVALPSLPSGGALGVIVINGVVAVSVWRCTRWFYPKSDAGLDDPAWRMATIALFVLPATFWMVFVQGGFQLLEIDLDADVQFWAGLIGFPLMTGFGAALAWGLQQWRRAKGQASEPRPAWNQGWSWQFVVGAMAFALSLPFVGACMVMWRLIGLDGDWHPATEEALVAVGVSGLTGLGVLVSGGAAASLIHRIRARGEPLHGRVAARAVLWFWLAMAGSLMVRFDSRPAEVGEKAAQVERRLTASRRAQTASLTTYEVVLTDPDDDPRRACLDLDGGRVMGAPVRWPPVGLAQAGDAQSIHSLLSERMSDLGIDLMSDASGRSLNVFGMALVGLAAGDFDNLTDQAIRQYPALTVGEVRDVTLEVPTTPATYAFRTRENGRGLLQITGFQEEYPRAVKLRYRRLPPAPRPVAPGVAQPLE